MLSSLSMGSPGACGSDGVAGGVFNSLLVFVCDLASFALCCQSVSFSRAKIRLHGFGCCNLQALQSVSANKVTLAVIGDMLLMRRGFNAQLHGKLCSQ